MCEKSVTKINVMDISIEKVADITLGSLFQQIIHDMKVSLNFQQLVITSTILCI